MIQEASLFDKDIVEPVTTAEVITLRCEQCGEPLTERAKSGGSPKRFCGPKCRNNLRNSQRFKDCEHVSETLRETLTNDANTETVRAELPQKQDTDDFNWATDDSVILREQKATAAYFNKHGELVIRQRGWPDDDTFIWVSPDHLDTFLDKLTDACGIPSMGKP